MTDSTVRGLITNSFRLAGIYQQGEALSAEDMANGQLSLVNLEDSWSNNSLLLYTTSFDVFSVSAGQGTYSMGPEVGADWVVDRPIEILALNSRRGTGIQQLDLPIGPLTSKQWAGMPVKNTTSGIPINYYDDRAYPNRNITLWPMPNETMEIVVWYYTQLSRSTDLDAEISLPPGYKRAIEYSLAVEVCPLYGKDPSPVIIQVANSSTDKLQETNAETPIYNFDLGLQHNQGRAIPWWALKAGYGIVI